MTQQTGMAPLILIVDDDEDVRALIVRSLSAAGYRIAARPSAEDLVEVVRERRPAAILLDISMPKVSGIEACAILKSSSVGALVPVIMLSAHDSFESVRRATDAGANAYLAKPFKREQMLNVLKRLLVGPITAGTAIAA